MSQQHPNQAQNNPRDGYRQSHWSESAASILGVIGLLGVVALVAVEAHRMGYVAAQADKSFDIDKEWQAAAESFDGTQKAFATTDSLSYYAVVRDGLIVRRFIEAKDAWTYRDNICQEMAKEGKDGNICLAIHLVAKMENFTKKPKGDKK